VQADAWSAELRTATGSGARWSDAGSPFGPLAAAGLVAAEAFKIGVNRLRDFASAPKAFDVMFSPAHIANVRLAPDETPVFSGRLPAIDIISAGAIGQAILYALSRIPAVNGDIRVVDPEKSDLSNLNRYAFLRRSLVGTSKVDHLSEISRNGQLGGIRVDASVSRFDDQTYPLLHPLADYVLVGTDDIPTRWRVQHKLPSWLGIGATTHYSAMASLHRRQQIENAAGCGQCAHPLDDPGTDQIPTVAFVSHWSGLWLSSYFVRSLIGPAPAQDELVFLAPLRFDLPTAVWINPVRRHPACPQHRRVSVAQALPPACHRQVPK
jgi:hypothetical protein